MRTFERITDTILLTVGSTYSLANIETILGIVILVINLAWIVTKLVYKIVKSIKKGEDLEIHDNEVSSVTKTIEDFKKDYYSRDEYDE